MPLKQQLFLFEPPYQLSVYFSVSFLQIAGKHPVDMKLGATKCEVCNRRLIVCSSNTDTSSSSIGVTVGKYKDRTE